MVFDNSKFSWKFEFEREVRQLLEQYNNCARLNQTNFNSEPKYHFHLSILPTGEKCLTVSEGNNQIIIAQSDFEEFYNRLSKYIKLLERGDSKNNKITEIKEKHPRAYEKWTIEEEQWLKNYLVEGLSIKEIAEILERQPGAISSRIIKLSLREPNNN